MNILQVHLELSDKPPKDTTKFKGKTINLPIDVKNSKDPIHLVGKQHYYVKCQRLFRPKISKVKTSFVAQIRQVSNTLMPNVGVSGDTPV